MIEFVVQIAGLLVLTIPLAVAAPSPSAAEDVTITFSFEQWAIDKSLDPTGKHHLSVEEVIAIANNRTFSSGE